MGCRLACKPTSIANAWLPGLADDDLLTRLAAAAFEHP
jgi:hypothetical protein